MEFYKFELSGLTISGNHFHLLIQTLPNEANISSIVQYIKARVAEKYNKQTNRIGPLWNERFGATIIELSDDPINYLFWLLWYLAFNPVRKNIVSDPRKYKYSSILSYLDKNYKSPVKITIHYFFDILGENYQARQKKFLVYEDAYRKRLNLIF